MEALMAVDMLIKKMPDDLKSWIAEQAQQHRRSLNQEAIALLERVRSLSGGTRTVAGDADAVVARLQARPVLDERNADAILGYDSNGLPQ
jgi:hypothetical protein